MSPSFWNLSAAKWTRLLGSRIAIHDVDLDRAQGLPRRTYGLALFLGTLYHLKNPFLVLETLAEHCAYCILSTRIAQMAGPGRVRIQDEPVAYLFDPREANDDPTNFWIFSETGLMRLIERSGFTVIAHRTTGCLEGSNPVEPAADERISVLARSRIRFPDLHVKLLHGWHAVEADGWRWTEKDFALQVLLPRDRPTKEFALGLTLPEVLLAASDRVTIECELNGAAGRSSAFATAGFHEFRGSFSSVDVRRPITLRFKVSHNFVPTPPDKRELGVIVPYSDDPEGAGSRIPFRIS
jgi:hypothetical protein